MEFEWDDDKNQLNFSKHRVDFAERSARIYR